MKLGEHDLLERLRIETGSMFISDMDFKRRETGTNAAALAALARMKLEPYSLRQLCEAARYLCGAEVSFGDHAEAASFFKKTG